MAKDKAAGFVSAYLRFLAQQEERDRLAEVAKADQRAAAEQARKKKGK